MCIGENLSMGVSTWQQAVQLWIDERGAYNWRSATFQSNAGHLCAFLPPAACPDASRLSAAVSSTPQSISSTAIGRSHLLMCAAAAVCAAALGVQPLTPRMLFYLCSTQMVWRGTTKLGCAVSKCGIWSCQYWPAGNYLGDFQRNVGRR